MASGASLISGSITDTAKNRRRTLRLLVLGGILFALLLASLYFTWRHQANERHSIGPLSHSPKTKLDPELAALSGVKDLLKIGARFQSDSPGPGKPVTMAFLTSTQASDADIAVLRSWTDLRVLDLTGTKVTDAGLEHLI
jgi:hypothetical protein